jgi:hypothetical protein
MHDDIANRVPAAGKGRLRPPAVLRYRALLLAAYPPLMAGAIIGEAVWLEALLLPLAGAIVMAPALVRRQRAAWLVLLVVAVVALTAHAQSWLGLWPPIVVTAAVAGWFGASLRPGSMPLIERFARVVLDTCSMEAEFHARATRWMRAWTAIWAAALATGATALAWAALGGHVTLWAWLSLALPLGLLALLCGEYALRRVLLPDHARMTLTGFLMALLATDWTDLPR